MLFNCSHQTRKANELTTGEEVLRGFLLRLLLVGVGVGVGFLAPFVDKGAGKFAYGTASQDISRWDLRRVARYMSVDANRMLVFA